MSVTPITSRSGWARALGEADAIGDAIARRLVDLDRDWFAGAGPAAVTACHADLRALTRAALVGIAGPAATVHEQGEESDRLWGSYARRQARLGRPLERVLADQTTAARMLWDELARRGSEIDLGQAGRRMWACVERQHAVIVATYQRETTRDPERQARVLEGLLDGRGSDPAYAEEVRDALGLRPDEAVAVVALADRPAGWRDPSAELEERGVTSWWHSRGGLAYGLVRLAGRTTPALATLVRGSVGSRGRAGVATAADGIAGVPTAYQLALATARTLPAGRPGVSPVEARLPEVLLAAAPAATELLVQEALGPVLAQSTALADTLIATLRALLDHDLSPTHAAEALFCHRNTVIYRSHQLEELTGRRLGDDRDRLLFSLALLALGR